MRRGRKNQGQTSTEYVLIISVVVVAVVAAAYSFIAPFRAGVTALATDVSTILASGEIGGIGLPHGGGGNPSTGASTNTAPPIPGSPVFNRQGPPGIGPVAGV